MGPAPDDPKRSLPQRTKYIRPLALEPIQLQATPHTMRSSVLIALLTVAAGAVHDTATGVIHRDVVIVGGGAAGAHAAVKLRDMGKTIVLVEKGDVLVSRDNAVRSRL